MKVAIVGSREFPDLKAVREYVQRLPEGTTVVTGGARGVDITAAEAAIERGLDVRVHHPDYKTHHRRAPLVRNETIARECDRMVAFWDGASTGTLHVTEYARKLGKLVEMHDPHGW